MPTSLPQTATARSARLSLSDLSPEQVRIVDRLYEDHCLLIAQAGAGKTVCAQTAAQELLDDGVLKRVLIVAPLRVCQLTWRKEWRYWEHLRPPALAIGTPEERIEAIESDANIVVINFENLKWFFDRYGREHGFDGLIIDEVSKLKAAGGTTFKSLRGGRGERITDFKWRVAMSATPVHEQGVDIYTPMLIVDGGKRLGTDQDRFRRRYFMTTDYKGYKWTFQPGMLEKLADRLGDAVLVADTEDYEASLPELQETVVPVRMPPEGWEAYDAMANSLYTQIQGVDIEAANLAVMQGKLQQICCGAVYNPVDRHPVWIHKEKFRQLGYLISITAEPAIIVYQFKYELELLRAMYPAARVLADDPDGAEEAWNAGECHTLLVHPKSAGHGINLQFGGCRMIWLSPVWSADLRDQTVRRIRRRGQPSPIVYIYTLICEDSVEELIAARSDDKLAAAAQFIEHLKERQK